MAPHELLCTLELDYRPELSEGPRYHRPPFGTYVGSGDGQAGGPLLSGAVQWDLFEERAPTVCDGHFAGVITTAEGAVIRFRALAYLQRPAVGARRWRVSAAVRFETDDPRYAWIAQVPASWQGHFDAETYHHSYRVDRMTDVRERRSA